MWTAQRCLRFGGVSQPRGLQQRFVVQQPLLLVLDLDETLVWYPGWKLKELGMFRRNGVYLQGHMDWWESIFAASCIPCPQVRVCCKGVHHNRNLRVGAPHGVTGPLKWLHLFTSSHCWSEILKLIAPKSRDFNNFQAYHLHQQNTPDTTWWAIVWTLHSSKWRTAQEVQL